MGLFFIFLALSAYLKVEMVSSKLESAGETHAIISVRVGVASEAVLEQPGQLGVPVWNVRVGTSVLFSKCADNVPEAQKTHVDVDPLLETISLGLGLLLPLGPGEIHHVELGDGESLSIYLGPGLDTEGEDGVRPGTHKMRIS